MDDDLISRWTAAGNSFYSKAFNALFTEDAVYEDVPVARVWTSRAANRKT